MLDSDDVGSAADLFFELPLKIIGTILLIVAIIAVGWYAYSKHSARVTVEEVSKYPLTTHVTDRGEVKSIVGCNVFKWVSTCKVITSKGEVFTTNLDAWPEKYLAPGSHLSTKVFTRGPVQMYYNCRDNLCEEVKVCKTNDCFNATYAKGNQP